MWHSQVLRSLKGNEVQSTSVFSAGCTVNLVTRFLNVAVPWLCDRSKDSWLEVKTEISMCNQKKSCILLYFVQNISTWMVACIRTFTFRQSGSVFSAGTEILKRAVVRSCDRAKIFWLCAKSWDLHAKTKFFFYFNLVFTVFSSFFTHIRWFLVIFFHFFLRKIWKIRFWPRKKSTFRMSENIIIIIIIIIIINGKKSAWSARNNMQDKNLQPLSSIWSTSYKHEVLEGVDNQKFSNIPVNYIFNWN